MEYSQVTMKDDIQKRAEERRKHEEKECEKNVTFVSAMLYSVSHALCLFKQSSL